MTLKTHWMRSLLVLLCLSTTSTAALGANRLEELKLVVIDALASGSLHPDREAERMRRELKWENPNHLPEAELCSQLEDLWQALRTRKDPRDFSRLETIHLGTFLDQVSAKGDWLGLAKGIPAAAHLKSLSRSPQNEPAYQAYLSRYDEQLDPGLRTELGAGADLFAAGHLLARQFRKSAQATTDERELRELLTRLGVKDIARAVAQGGRGGSSEYGLFVETKGSSGHLKLQMALSKGPTGELTDSWIGLYDQTGKHWKWKVVLDRETDLFRAELYAYRGEKMSGWKVLHPALAGSERNDIQPALLPLDEIYSGKALEHARRVSARTDRTLVAVVDTGVDYNHPELAYKLLRAFETAGLSYEQVEALRAGQQEREKALQAALDEQQSATEGRSAMLLLSSLPAGVATMLGLLREKKTCRSMLAYLTAAAAFPAGALALSQPGVDEARRRRLSKLREASRERELAVGWNVDDDDALPYDYDAHWSSDWKSSVHGTLVAGMVVQDTDDLAVLPIKMTGQGKDLERAVDIARARGARIANFSFSLRPGMLEAARAHPDMLFVIAAGNGKEQVDIDREDGWRSAWADLAAQPNVLVVSGLKAGGELADYSFYGGETVHIAAPGDRLLAPSAGGRHEEASGTSLAAGVVSRAAGLLQHKHPDWSPTRIAEVLMRTARRTQRVKGKVRSGVLDPEAALAAE